MVFVWLLCAAAASLPLQPTFSSSKPAAASSQLFGDASNVFSTSGILNSSQSNAAALRGPHAAAAALPSFSRQQGAP
ncbi:hypothetical protein EON66_09585, partial [archaeon]